MKKKVEEIYNSLPSKWEDVTVGTFIKLTEIEVIESGDFVDAENILKIISVFTGISTDELETLPIPIIARFSEKLDFMIELPTANKTSSIKLKGVNEISYGNYILYQQFGSDFMKNLPLLIPAFIKTETTADEVLKMNMVDAYTAFFLHRKALKKSLRSMMFYLEMKIMFRKMKEWITKIRFKAK